MRSRYYLEWRKRTLAVFERQIGKNPIIDIAKTELIELLLTIPEASVLLALI